MKKKTVTKAKSEDKSYKATIKVMGKTYESVGVTISDAISGLKPGNCKGKAILTIETNDAKKERILMPMVTSRLFNTFGMTKEIALKQASTLFQGI